MSRLQDRYRDEVIPALRKEVEKGKVRYIG